jgi:23S rRNA pseudouridine1911/1915/1917 synthase
MKVQDNMENQEKLLVVLDGERLDKFIFGELNGMSRSKIANLIKNGMVTLNGVKVKVSHRLKVGDIVEMNVSEPSTARLIPQNIDLEVVFEDKDVIVIDKPAGMVVHPAPGHTSDTLVNALINRLPDIYGVGDELRPGIVHRLDKNTSGLMMIAKNRNAYDLLVRQVEQRVIHKGYLALVKGVLDPPEAIIRGDIARDPGNRKRMAVVNQGRYSETYYRSLENIQNRTMVEVFPKTGRTHQIRVHFANVGHPIVGDQTYGGKDSVLARQFLHAHILGFHLPSSGEYTEKYSPLPKELADYISILGSI